MNISSYSKLIENILFSVNHWLLWHRNLYASFNSRPRYDVKWLFQHQRKFTVNFTIKCVRFPSKRQYAIYSLIIVHHIEPTTMGLINSNLGLIQDAVQTNCLRIHSTCTTTPVYSFKLWNSSMQSTWKWPNKKS